MENKLTKAFKASINDEAINLTKEILDKGLDAAIPDEALKHVPILGAALSIYKVGSTMREWHNLKKIAVFLTRLETLSDQEKTSFLKKIDESDKYRESVFEKVLLLLEHLDETMKAEMIGNLFRNFIRGKVSKGDFLRLSGIVERTFLDDLLTLYYHYNLEDPSRHHNSKQYPTNEVNQAALTSAGLLSLRNARSGNAPITTSTFFINSVPASEPALSSHIITKLGRDLVDMMLEPK